MLILHKCNDILLQKYHIIFSTNINEEGSSNFSGFFFHFFEKKKSEKTFCLNHNKLYQAVQYHCERF